MFQIKITEPLSGKILLNVMATRYLAVIQNKTDFTKAFSTPDLIDQLGLLEFAKAQMVEEVKHLPKSKGGEENDNSIV